MNMKKELLIVIFLMRIFSLHAYEIRLTGGASMDIPESWELTDNESSVPSWYSPDKKAGTEVMLWAPGTWESIDDFIEKTQIDGAEGDVFNFPCWSGRVALAIQDFPGSDGFFRGWFLFVTGTGPDVRVSAIASKEDFPEREAFFLSILDSYTPGDNWRLTPGAISTFLEITGDANKQTVSVPFGESQIRWEQSSASNQASQDVIEREALVLSAYVSVPEFFFPAWERYYRLIYRDNYNRMKSLAEAFQYGPLPKNPSDPRAVAEALLGWLQGFSYGSTDGFSDLLSPASACSGQTGDCDSLSLVLLILMAYYDVDGTLLLSQQIHHALAGLNLSGDGLRYTKGENSWIIAELTTRQPLGIVPKRVTEASDWFGISF